MIPGSASRNSKRPKAANSNGMKKYVLIGVPGERKVFGGSP